MGLKKGTIIFSLLFSYLLGFSHQLIPHCHHGEGGQNLALEYSHKHSSNNHDHITSGDHKDHGFWDFLIRQIEDVEHPSSGVDHWVYYPDQGLRIKTLLDEVGFSFFEIEPGGKMENRVADLTIPRVTVISSIQDPPTHSLLRRGPPDFS